MTWGLASYETRIRWIAALWAILMTVWCMCPLSWQVRLIGGAIWVLATALGSLFCAWWRPRSDRTRPIFLALAGVCGEPEAPRPRDRILRARDLEALIEHLFSAGYRFQTLWEALTAPIRKSVVLTFDGGSRDLARTLYPILQRLRAKATCFIAAHDPEDPNRLKPLEIQEMARSGLVEFGGQLDAVPEDPAALRAAVENNRNWLTGVLGAIPYACLYPKVAATSEALRTALQEAGYRAACYVAAKAARPAAVAEPFAIALRAMPGNLCQWQAYLLATRGRWSAF